MLPITVSVARVPTASASRYLQQLAKHWSYKMEVRFDAEEGTIEFPSGSRLEMRADSDTLDLKLSLPEGEDAGRMQAVVADHINRFAFREGRGPSTGASVPAAPSRPDRCRPPSG